ncbi:amino acid adenylation domain-containing protein [Chryseobacterium gallinarum]|uniref:non-ribosomal peptide synthetase n=1 Tax=Chryseobacterium gallinarum TaxID=1324352 RepID=UPI00202483BE|nr:non-ribosomal peptide synthetase [Chryseobacterium gallinarum]MCL8537177.1 amino acid adenylation domain-containing protein [Chryseobacterium gallinarum]
MAELQSLPEIFWQNKIRNREKVVFSKGCIKSIRKEIAKENFQSFIKISKSNPLSQFSIVSSVFSFIINAYFENYQNIIKIYPSNSIDLENFLLLETEDNTITFKELLQDIAEEIKEVFSYKHYNSLELNLESFSNFSIQFGQKVESLNDDISLLYEETEKNIIYTIFYNESYPDYIIESVLKNFINILSDYEVFLNKNRRKYSFIDKEERHQLLVKFNDNKVEYLVDRTIVQLFEEQVVRTPENVAVVFEDTKLSYLGLNEKANQLAHYIKNNHTIESGQVIATLLPKSIDLLISLLAIEKLGCIYLPIDVNYPKERIHYILEDSNAKVLLSENSTIQALNIRQTYISLESDEIQFESTNNLNIEIKHDDVAYLIYTSGSTGKPKGVLVEHYSSINMSLDQIKTFKITAEDKIVWFASVAFDASISEILMSLYSGATLCIPTGEEQKNKDRFISFLEKTKSTIVTFPPSYLELLSNDDLKGLKTIITAGESANPLKAKEIVGNGINYYNAYGPTEYSVCTSIFKLEPHHNYTTVPIGRPISNTQVYILNADLNIVPIGISGDLYISGPGLSRGYLNKPELTAEKFIMNPFEEGMKMYDTGDLARWLPDGNIEFLGRKDFQVKIRGYRIELGEIETNISQFSKSIKQIVTVAKEISGEKVLVAYYTTDEKISVNKTELREYLLSRVPEYMVPGFFVELGSIPLTPNGKIDRNALPDVTGEDLIRKEYVAPGNVTEEKLAEIWQKVLGIQKVGITDNFFELGGHSLMVNQVLNRIHHTLSMQVSFKDFFAFPTIEGITQNFTKKEYIPIPKAPEQENYPLTPSQQRLWVLSQLEGGSQAYNMPAVVTLRGELNIELFDKAFQYLIERHEILRTSFKSDKLTGEIRQYITAKLEPHFRIEILDFTDNIEQDIEDYLHAANTETFNLEESPLIRASLLKRADNEYLFFLSMHHIIGDGWSTEILVSEVVESYNRLVKGKDIEKVGAEQKVTFLSIQYKDYTVWLQQERKGKKYQKAEAYWLEQFEGDLPVLELPSYKTRPLIQTYNGNNLSHLFSREFTEKLKQYSDKQGVTLFMTLMAGIKALLYRYTGQQDIIVGTPIAGREHPDLENQIGLYLNTLAIRTKLEKDQNTFTSVLKKEKDTLLSAYEHQIYPFDELVGKLNIKRDTSRSALFDVLVVFQNQNELQLGSTQKDIEHLQVEGYDYHRKISQFDVSYTFSNEGEQLGLTIEYNTDIYDKFLIQRMFPHFENLLTRIIEDQTEEVIIEDIDFLMKEERHHLLVEFNDNKVDHPDDKIIVQLFEEQVAKAPENVAVVFEDTELTYRVLNEAANQLGDYLRQNYDIEPDDLVAVKLERSEKMIVAILGILKSGAAYVPIDPEYPQERVEYIEKDANTKVTIDESFLESFQEELQKVKDHYRRENLPIISQPNSLAYVIYTSGTTGQPKGVMIENKSVTDRLFYEQTILNLNSDSRCFFTTNFVFDVSVLELLLPLISGAMTVIPNQKEVFESESYLEAIKKYKLNLLQGTPSFFISILKSENISLIDHSVTICVGGEPLNLEAIDVLEKVFTRGKINNHYGPTETTIDAIIKENINSEDFKNNIIGRPISNTQAYILDDHLNVIPIGVIGKLYVSGSGLSRGYLNKPELTSEMFIDNLFETGMKMYDTGDLARWLPNGNIEFLGRKDSQVKIRGYRIELGEIETNIVRFSSAIKQVVANVKETDGEKALVAYYSKDREASIDKTELREYLQSKLPEYMVPGFFVELDTIPLTPNGKIDRKALPDITEEDIIRREYVAPRNETEHALVEIWQEVLGVNKVGITDNFFELGGHSLMVVQVLNKMHQRLFLQISFKDFFSGASIIELSDNLTEKTYKPIPKALEAIAYPLSAAQKRIWILSQLENSSVAYNMPGAVKLTGDIDKNKLEESFRLLIGRHEILRTYFKTNGEGEVFQYIVPVEQAHFRLDEEDYSLIDDQENAVINYLQVKSKKIFDLGKAVLMHASLIKLTQSEYVFFLLMHHIIGDGWSMELLISEVIRIYNALMRGEEVNLTKNHIQYKDFAVWQNEELQKQKFKTSEKYWLTQFSGDIPVLNLPSFHSRPLIQTYNGNSLVYQFPTEFLEKLKNFSKSNDATLFMTLLAGINILLNKYTGQNDIIVGTPIAGRQHPDLENQLGLFLNTLAIRTFVDGTNSFLDIVLKQKEALSNAYQHQDYPFDELVTKLNLKKDTSRSALFDVMVVLQSQDQLKSNHKEDLFAVQVSEYSFSRMLSQSDLRFSFTEKEGLELMIDYNTDIYDTYLIERIFNHFRNLIERLIEDAGKSIKDVGYLSQKEEIQLIRTFNATKIDYPKEKTIVELFEDQVSETPHNIAVIFEEVKLTYKELNAKANQLAYYLRDNYSVKPDDFVGIRLNRSEMMIVAILGVLKSGSAYVPVDITYPKERQDYIEKDTDCKVVLDEDEFQFFNLQRFIYSEENLESINSPSDLAYVIYTSGSTGNPKGVIVEHRNVVRLVKPCSFFPLSDRSTLLSTGSISFDATIIEFFGTLLNGAKLVLTSQNNLLDLSKLEDIIKKYEVNCLWMTASWLNTVVENKISLFSYISQLIVGGDVVSPIYTRKIFETNTDIKIVNGYGPTENTTFSATFDIQNKKYATIPIGKPIPNSFAYILDESMYPVPIGVTGKLYVGGDGVARGYLNNPELTTEKFLVNPFEDGRIYDTGDLARWLPDGNIEFLGRNDQQVKIRGYRIELQEIENTILSYSEQLKHVVVESKEVNGEKVLVAYYTKDNDSNVNKIEVRKYLQNKLPEYMVPGFFIELEVIPLTPNGKIDRMALPDVMGGDLIRREYMSPRNETEQKLAEIWQEVLGADKVGITDNFFELGGDSIHSIRLLSKINKLLKTNYKLSDIFELPSISELLSIRFERIEDEMAQVIKQEVEESFSNLSKELNSEDITSIYPISDIELGMLYTSLVDSGKGIYHDQFLFSIPILNFDVSVFTQAINLLVDKHEILRTAFNFESYSVPVHLIYEKIKVPLDVEDISSKDQKIQYEYINQFMIEERTENWFDLSKPGLWRMKIYKQGPQEWNLLFQFHHAILDGWSVASLITELNNTYLQLLDNPDMKLEKLSLSYRDYVFNETCIKKSENQYEYWKDKLLDYEKLDIFTEEVISKRYEYILEGDFYSSVYKFITEHGVGIKVLNFSAYLYALQMLTYKKDITVGIVTNGRPLSEDGDKLLGCFLNTVPFRLKGQNMSILEFVKEIDQAINIQKRFEGVSLLELHTRFSNEGKGENPFFDTFFNYIDLHIYNELNSQEKYEDKESQFLNATFEATNTFLDLTVCPIVNGVKISWHLQRNLKNGFTIEQIQGYYFRFLEMLLDNPYDILNNEAILSSKELYQLLYEFNDTNVEYPGDKTIIQLFEEQAKKTPDHVAVCDSEIKLSYRELKAKSDNSAKYLISKLGENNGTVGVLVERSAELLVLLLGIFKSGKSYIPIDPMLPKERIEYIIHHSQASIIITEEPYLQEFNSINTENTANFIGKDKLLQFENTQEVDTDNIPKPEDTAYIIYTSGSTGNPKGVEVGHQALTNFLTSIQSKPKVQPQDILYSVTTCSFDISILEFFTPLISGATVFIAGKETLNNIEQLKAELETINPTIIQATPSFYQMLFNAGWKGNKNMKILCGGDSLNESLAEKLLNHSKEVWNMYGPTETTIWSSTKKIEIPSDASNIGKPINNTQIYIVDKHHNLLPQYTVGRIFIAGDGLAKGYYKNEMLTEEKFINNPFSTSEKNNFKMYETGDLGKWNEEGEIEFLGRTDFQVKVRGFRIELGEIESHLEEYAGILETVADAKIVKGEKVLVAYYTTEGRDPLEKAELREYLQKKLPAYMVPGFFVELETIPLTPNGKIDRKALPDVTIEDLIRREYIAPGNEMEEKLVEIWQEVLGLDRVGVTDNFFELGGNSISSIRIINKILEHGYKCTVRDLYDSLNIEKLSETLLKIEHKENKPQYSHYKNTKLVNISQKLIDKLENQ